MSKLNPEDIELLVIHCADTPNHKEFTAADIHRWHVEQGWDGIGYHAVIRRSGLVERGRPEYWKGAHAKAINDKSLGVCLIGTDKFTDNQWASLKQLITDWLIKYPNAEVVGHYQFDDDKTCPNFNVTEWWYGYDRA